MKKIAYTNFAAVITGMGFNSKNGRKVEAKDLNILEGPINILCIGEKISEISRGVPAGFEKVNCDGLVATPAFVDSHTHAIFGGSRWSEFFDRWAGKSYTDIAKSGGGIVKTFQDTKAATSAELFSKLKANLDLIAKTGVRLLEIKSGYGESFDEEERILRILNTLHHPKIEIKKTFLGLHALPKGKKESDFTDEMIKGLTTVKEEKLADFVDAFPEKGFFSVAATKRFFEAAQNIGFGLRLHADEITAMGASELGIEMNALSIDHLQKISKGALKKLKKSQTIATLLPATSFFLGIDYAPARKILDAGARVALATDFNPGTAPEYSILFTTRLAAAQMKMTPAEIFCAITYNAAAAMGCDERMGILKAGYDSKIIFWKCDSKNIVEEILLSGLLPN